MAQSAEPDDDIEQTLHIARSVSVYRIPPRPGVNGWRSGEWLVSWKLFSGRMRVVSKGELCEIRLEDPNSGELFAVCPVPFGQRNVCVEPVTDSSRYYVLRVEDPSTHRHAFLGMGFDERADAFDFNEALVRHEQHIAREQAARARTSADGSSPPSGGDTSHASPQPSRMAAGSPATSLASAANSSAAAEVDVLYRETAGLRLQEGQTIRVNVSGIKKPGAAASSGGGFLSSTTASFMPLRARGPTSLAPPPVVLAPRPPPDNAKEASAPVVSMPEGATSLPESSQPLGQPTVAKADDLLASLLDAPTSLQSSMQAVTQTRTCALPGAGSGWATFD